jgi:hypothetical protein
LKKTIAWFFWKCRSESNGGKRFMDVSPLKYRENIEKIYEKHETFPARVGNCS